MICALIGDQTIRNLNEERLDVYKRQLAYPLSKRFFSEADPSGKETGILDKFLDQPGLSDAPPTIDVYKRQSLR